MRRCNQKITNFKVGLIVATIVQNAVAATTATTTSRQNCLFEFF
jgi:hypothetical protein